MNDSRIGSGDRRQNGPSTVSAGEAEEIDRLCDRFEAAWRSGEHPRLEDHLRGDGLFRSLLKSELMAVELEWRRRREGAAAPARSVLETLGPSIGPVPHVLLRDTDGGPEPPLLRPNRGAGADPALRYRIDGEIARGGMGSVLKGHDPDIGRDVALKVLRDDFRDDPDMVRRFLEEVQIGGQLQHPGIVPIYEMGTFADHRPFFSMKLVKGDTLAQLLEHRKHPGDELPRFLSIFESIAQTVAYAHARGVIHRDLKPSNVMVGSFGEVQVMDWGLAKVLPRGGVVDDEHAGKLPQGETIIATARSGSADSDLSRAGSVLGTPSFMAPEQARGEIDRVDERADVFALGSILCEILSGQPAFTGRTSGEIQRRAAVGDLADAFARLDASGADTELIALARDCLAREPEGRPRSAAAVSDRVTAYLAGVQERLRRAEMERIEERARRRLITVAAAAVILLGLLGGGGYAWNQRQRAERIARTARAVDEALADAARLLGEARSAPPNDVGRWSAAVAAAKRAEGLLAQGEADALLKSRVDTLMTAVERDRAAAAENARQIEIDRILLADLESVRANRVAHRDLKRTDAEYAEVFRKAGLDVDAIGAEEAGRWLASRTDPIELAGYLDDWAFTRRRVSGSEGHWRRLVTAARVGDPHPWRDALRAKFGDDDPGTVAQFRRMADDPELEDQPAPGLLLLARQLKFGCDDGTRAAQVLRKAARRYPGDFRIHFELAHAPGATDEASPSLDQFPDPEEAVRHLTTAMGIRSKSLSTHMVLGIALIAYKKPAEAEAEFREAVRLKPDDPSAHAFLGNALRWQGKHSEGATECREAVRLRPDRGWTHYMLALVLKDQQKFDEAAAELREAYRLLPGTKYLVLLADVFHRKGDHARALTLINKAKAMTSRSLADTYYTEAWFAKLEVLATLEARIPAILNGDDHPKDSAERLELAQMCYKKRLFAASARFWAEALDEEPKLGDDRRAQHRYNAACSAALAVGNRGKDQPTLDAAARTDLRRRAFRWLEAELADWSKYFESDQPKKRETVGRTMRHWKLDADLAAVRDPHALSELLDAERKDWLALWDRVDALMRKAGEPKPP